MWMKGIFPFGSNLFGMSKKSERKNEFDINKERCNVHRANLKIFASYKVTVYISHGMFLCQPSSCIRSDICISDCNVFYINLCI